MGLFARSTLALCLAWSILTSASASEPLAVVKMLTRGTIVSRFGTIGEGGVFAQGIDARGRVLFIGTLDDGRQGLFWGQAGSYETLWLPDEFKGLIGMAVTNGAGRVVMTRRDREGVWRFLERVIGPDQTAVVAKFGDVDSEGFMIVELRGVRINDSGTIGFAAEVSPTGQDCVVDQCGIRRAIYVAVEGGLQVLAREGVGNVEKIDHIDAILNDGSVLFGGDANGEHGVFRATLAAVEPYEDLRNRPGSYVITRSVGASPNGVVALELEEEGVRGVYRIVDSSRALVASPGTPPNWVQPGSSFEVSCVGQCVVNAVGDVVVWATWATPDRLAQGRAILLYPGSGASPSVIVQDGPPPPGIEGESIRVGTSMRINDAGTVVAHYYLVGGDSNYWIGVWGSGVLVPLRGVAHPRPVQRSLRAVSGTEGTSKILVPAGLWLGRTAPQAGMGLSAPISQAPI